MAIKLGLNTGFAINRFTTPEEWVPLVADTFGIESVQFTADLLNPCLPPGIVDDQIKRTRDLCARHKVKIEHTFTSAFTRVNHLAHPDAAMRSYWRDWFKKFIDISVALGAESMGSHLGIMTVRDCSVSSRREERLGQVIEAWRDIADYAAARGLSYLCWEPMSVAREFGHTIQDVKEIQNVFSSAPMAVPMRLCLDVDHGDLASSNPDDTNPYVWIKEFAHDVSLIHLKQTLRDKGGHWPFISEYNERGRIAPDEFISVLDKAGISDVSLLLELSFREREPFESRVINDIKTSVDYWRPFVAL